MWPKVHISSMASANGSVPHALTSLRVKGPPLTTMAEDVGHSCELSCSQNMQATIPTTHTGPATGSQHQCDHCWALNSIKHEETSEHHLDTEETTSQPDVSSEGCSEFPASQKGAHDAWNAAAEQQGEHSRRCGPSDTGSEVRTHILKIWSADHAIKKLVSARTMPDMIKQAREKGVCSSENVKVFLKDWTEIEEDLFQDVVNALPMNERIFIVAETVPQAKPAQPGPLGRQHSCTPKPASPQTTTSGFRLDVKRLPHSVQDALHSSASPIGPRERRELVRCIVDQMTRKCSRPRREFLRAVAEEVVRAFPCALEDRGLDGKLLGRGYDSVFQQLECRVENLSRRKRPASLSKDRTAQKSLKRSYGCLNEQPMLSSDDSNSAEEKVEFCKQEGKSAKDADLPQASKYMEETYNEQRKFINSNPAPHTAEIKEKWPLLFRRPLFYKHADRLLGKDVKEIFQKRLASCAPRLFEHQRTMAKTDVIYWTVQAEHAANGNPTAQHSALFPLLAAHFKDSQGDLFRIFDNGTNVSQICSQLPSTPIVVALGSIFTNQCFVVCEQLELFGEPTDFAEAMCLEFLVYYVFNLVYPASAATTLEFIQRQLFDINPCKGSKCQGKQKSRTSVNSKVMKLVQALRANL